MCLAFNDTHTKKHRLVRVTRKVEDSKVSTEQRLKAVLKRLGPIERRLGKEEIRQLKSIQEEIRQLFLELFEKGTGGFPGDPLTKGDVLGAVTVEPSVGGSLLIQG